MCIRDSLHVLQKADVVRETIAALRDLRKHAQHVVIELARIGLPRHAIHFFVPEFSNDALFKFLHLFAVAVKKVEDCLLYTSRCV